MVFVPVQEQFAENTNQSYHVCRAIVVLHIYHKINFDPYQILSSVYDIVGYFYVHVSGQHIVVWRQKQFREPWNYGARDSCAVCGFRS